MVGERDFVCQIDDLYVRLSTNVMNADGARAVGTILNHMVRRLKPSAMGSHFMEWLKSWANTTSLGMNLCAMCTTRSSALAMWATRWICGCYVRLSKIPVTLRQVFSAVLDDKNQVRFSSIHVSPGFAQRIITTHPDNWVLVKNYLPSWKFQVVVAYPDSGSPRNRVFKNEPYPAFRRGICADYFCLR